MGIDNKSAWCFLVGVSSNRGILIGLGGLGLGAGLLRATTVLVFWQHVEIVLKKEEPWESRSAWWVLL